ncbi:MAG: hypothetical protein HY784_10840 [Chloroflexi bacterium]|nr:hypothetical protein [Chloroflexota bacterium]
MLGVVHRRRRRQRLVGYKVPKSVVFVAELPKTGANKVDKRALVARYGG